MGYLIYEKRSQKKKILAVIGSIIPDASLIVAFPFLALTSFAELLNTLRLQEDVYINSGDFLIGVVLNSVWLWLALIAAGKFLWKPLLPIGVGAMVHVFADALTHQGSWAWNHFYPLNITPLQGPFDFMNPWFLLVEHVIWIVIFAPRIWRYFHINAT
jgi:hypothetical protein